MKRTFTYALTAILASAIVAPAFAQDNFPDVPDNHWAFEALKRMKTDGILVGYPDGLFRGTRPASRYELAVAINAAYTNLKNQNDSLSTQIEELKKSMGGDGASKADLQQLKDALTALQNEHNAMRGMGDDVANLRKMADAFQKELQQLGVDVEAMKRDLGDLSKRVEALEKKKPAVEISGDINLFIAGGNSRDGNFGLDKDGRTNGFVGGKNVGLTRDLSILHEGAFTFQGTNETGPKWKATLVNGNLLGGGSGFVRQSGFQTGTAYGEGAGDVYLQDFSVKFNSAVAGLGFDAEVGRVGYKINPYVFQRIDNTSYFSNERWDSGKYLFDGAIVGFNLGGVKVDVFGGRNSKRLSNNGTEINQLQTGNRTSAPLTIDRSLGITAALPLTSTGSLNLAYLWLDSDTTLANGANRDAIYGVSGHIGLGKIKVEGGFYQSDVSKNTSRIKDGVLDKDNRSYYGGVSSTLGKLNWFAKYQRFDANYSAPGDWGRLGIMRNPTNVQGVVLGGDIDLTEKLTLKAGGTFYEGASDKYAGSTGLNKKSKVNSFSVDLNYKLAPAFNVYVGYEDTTFDKFQGITGGKAVAAGAKPTYRWTTFGFGYGLSEATKLTLQYQLSDIKNDFQATNIATNTFKGGLFTTQLSVKF